MDYSYDHGAETLRGFTLDGKTYKRGDFVPVQALGTLPPRNLVALVRGSIVKLYTGAPIGAESETPKPRRGRPPRRVATA